MSIFIEVTCAMCGRDTPERHPASRGAFPVMNVQRTTILDMLQKRGWIVVIAFIGFFMFMEARRKA